VKVALLTPAFRGYNAHEGGIATHFAELADALQSDGHDVTVVTPLPERNHQADPALDTKIFAPFSSTMPMWLHKLTGLRWQFHSLAGALYRSRSAAKTMVRAAAEAGFEVVETTSSGCLAMSYLKLRHRAPVVTRISTTAAQLVSHNDSLAGWRDRIEQQWESRLVSLSDWRVTHTNQHREELCHQWNILPENVAIVPHGIRIPRRDQLLPPKRSEAIEVLYVGRFEHRKGIDILLEAIPQVLARLPTACFKLIGNDDRNWQRNFWKINSSLPRERVAFLGRIDDARLKDAYRTCDIFVAPSRYESFGLIYAEAMAWARPAIGCRVGGVPEVISDGETGVTIPAENAKALADAVCKLANNPQMRENMGISARLRVEKRFSHSALAAASVALYTQVIGHRA
jgi:glycosyltransferase involved in cell wall biosynthesis